MNQPHTEQFINAYIERDKICFLERRGSNRIKHYREPSYCAFINTSELSDDQAMALTHLCFQNEVKNVSERDNWTRIDWHDIRTDERDADGRRIHIREKQAKNIETYGIRTYEADVSPIKRYMAENDVKIQRPKRAYLDIETDSRVPFDRARNGGARVLSWAIVDEYGRKYSGVLRDDSDKEERDLLQEMWAVLEDFDQIVAWNGDGFDFPVIRTRSKILDIRGIEFRQWLYIDQMLVFKRNNIMSADSGDEKQSFKLNDIAVALLGEGKEELDGSQTWQYWESGGDRRKALVSYNIQDTDLLRKIEEKTGYLELFQTLAEVCGVFPDSRGLKPTQQVDAFMMKLGFEHNVHFPTKWYGDDSQWEKFLGAYVMQPTKTGILKNVHVADFASLYPNIMITWNLSPEMKTMSQSGSARSPLTNVRTKVDHPGLLPIALQQLLNLRSEWTKKRAECAPGTAEAKDAERRTNAYKTAANSFYGVMGTPFSRFFDREISESTTQNGKWLIQLTLEEANKRGMETIYADSITGDRTVVLMDDRGDIIIRPVEWLFESSVNKFSERGKEFGMMPGWKALAKSEDGVTGWFPLKCLIRHKTKKELHFVSTKRGETKVTADHSIICNNREMPPTQFVETGAHFETVDVPKIQQKSTIDLFEYLKNVQFVKSYKGRPLVRYFAADDEWITLCGWGESKHRLKRFFVDGSPEMNALIRLFGAFISEGSSSIQGITTCRYMWSIAQNDQSWLERLKTDIKLITKDIPIGLIHSGGGTFALRNGGALLACLFAALCGFKSHKKRIPDFVYSLSDESKTLFLQLLFEGDGSVSGTKEIAYTTISQELIAGVSVLLNQFAIEHSFYYRKNKKCWTIRTRPAGKERSRQRILHEIETPTEEQYVYDLSVEGANRFVDGVGRVLLHNTDSCFVVGGSAEEFGKFVDWCNTDLYPAKLRDMGCVTNKIKLAYEKQFERVVFCSAKRYCGVFAHYKGKAATSDSKPEIKGLEYKRGDTNRIAREMQSEVIQKFVTGEENPDAYVSLVRSYLVKTLSGELAMKEIVLSKSISRELGEYAVRRRLDGVETSPMHVALAQSMKKRGLEVSIGTRINYIVVDGTTSPKTAVLVEDYQGNVDRHYLWENLVYPPTFRLLSAMFPEYDWKKYSKSRPTKRFNPDRLNLFG